MSNETTKTNRLDPRYLADASHPSAVLVAWFNDLPMGAWSDNDREAFLAAIIDELRELDWNPEDADFDTDDISIEEVEDVEIYQQFFESLRSAVTTEVA